jgi:hypothetical protein
MAMFDYFRVEYPLPLDSYILSEYRPFVQAVVDQDDFQSKDMDCVLARYYIDNCGYIYKSNKIDFEDDSDPVFEKIYYHGHIRIYSLVPLGDEGWDSNKKFWLEYDLKFTDSLLVSARMLHPTKEELHELRLH